MLRWVGWMGVAALVVVGCEGTQRVSEVVASPALPGAATSTPSGGGGSSDIVDDSGERPQSSAIDDLRPGPAGERSADPGVDDAGSRLPVPQDSADAGAPAEAICPGCLVDDVCFAPGQREPDNACRVCDPSVSASAWSPNDGVTCDDGLFCTVEDACSNGSCIGTARECEDGVDCNGVSVCNEASDTCSPAINGCGNGALCNVQTNACVSTCSGCLVDGVCFASGTEANGNPCFVCDPTRDATSFSIAVGKSCGAEPSACSQQDSCDTAGRCQPNHLAPGTPCGSSVTSACDQPDSCDGAGSCQQRLVPNGTTCDDGAFCTTGDQCQAGQCVSTGTQSCGANRACNEATNQCQCQGCTIGGTCVAAGAVNPANPCQVCDPGRNASGFSAGANGAPCDDGAFCTVGDQCQGAACVGVTPRSCGSNQRCDETANACVAVPTPTQIAFWATEAAQGSTPLPVTSVVQGVTGSIMTIGPGLRRDADRGSIFTGARWPSDGQVDLTKYIEVVIATSGPGRTISYDRVEFGIGARGGFPSSTAVIPTSWQLRTDRDVFQLPVASGTALISLNESTIPIVANVRSIGSVAGSVTFRIYMSTSDGIELGGLGIVDLRAFGVVE